MAKRTVVTMVSDLSEEEATETVVFALDGTTYEIDLTDEEALELRHRLKVFVDHARKRGTRVRADNSNVQAIRTWAREQGIEVPARGRLPQALKDQYEKAAAS